MKIKCFADAQPGTICDCPNCLQRVASRQAALNAIRLAADAVVKAADLAFSRQMTERDAEIMEVPIARIALAVLAHRKAKAEQAKEARRG